MKMGQPGSHPVLLSASYHLDSFGMFQRGGVREACLFVAREVIKRCTLGSLVSVKHQNYICHCRVRNDGFGVAVVCDDNYPKLAAYSLISQASEAYLKVVGDKWKAISTDQTSPNEGVMALLVKYQDPAEGDKVTKIQNELEEIRQICIKTIEDLLERDKKLEQLVKDTEDLSFVTKSFADKSADLNRCCTIL